MTNPDIQNYLEDFSVDDLDKLSPFLQDAFSRIKYAFNSRLNFKDCSFTVDFAKEELASFVSSALKEDERVWKYKMALSITLIIFLLLEKSLMLG